MVSPLAAEIAPHAALNARSLNRGNFSVSQTFGEYEREGLDKERGMTREIRQVELDGLRLIGLGRVPRCKDCPRYASLVEHYVDPRPAFTGLAAVPTDCEHCYCAPLVNRYEDTRAQFASGEVRAAS